jgi:hypothetical protein
LPPVSSSLAESSAEESFIKESDAEGSSVVGSDASVSSADDFDISEEFDEEELTDGSKDSLAEVGSPKDEQAVPKRHIHPKIKEIASPT